MFVFSKGCPYIFASIIGIVKLLYLQRKKKRNSFLALNFRLAVNMFQLIYALKKHDNWRFPTPSYNTEQERFSENFLNWSELNLLIGIILCGYICTMWQISWVTLSVTSKLTELYRTAIASSLFIVAFQLKSAISN
jgi:hypothetical protein